MTVEREKQLMEELEENRQQILRLIEACSDQSDRIDEMRAELKSMAG